MLNLVKSVGNEGLLGSNIPAIYLKQYGEKLELRKNDGSKVKLITLLGSLTDITMEQRDSQQIYYFNDHTTNPLTIQRQPVLKSSEAEPGGASRANVSCDP